jgi:hypothetical protein
VTNRFHYVLKEFKCDDREWTPGGIPVQVEIGRGRISRREDAGLLFVAAMVHRELDLGAGVGVLAAGEVLAVPELRVGRAAGGSDPFSPSTKGVAVRHDLGTVRQLTHVARAECSRLTPSRRAPKKACGSTNHGRFPNTIPGRRARLSNGLVIITCERLGSSRGAMMATLRNSNRRSATG